MLIGIVKFFDARKGYGYIKNPDSGTETFVHISGLIDEVKENDLVSYQLERGKKGEVAVNVKRVERK